MKDGPYIHARCHPTGTLAQDIAIHQMDHPSSLTAIPTLAPVPSSDKASSPDNHDSDLKWWEHAAVIASKYDDPSAQARPQGKWLNFMFVVY
jgi:hypothetical protein